MSIGYKVPAQAHMEREMQQKMWKNKIYHKKEIEHDEERVSLQGQTDSPGEGVCQRTWLKTECPIEGYPVLPNRAAWTLRVQQV